MIRSKFDYASFVYECASEFSKRRLDSVHHASLRVVTGAFRTSPVASLLAEAHEPPLSLRRQMLCMRYAFEAPPVSDSSGVPIRFLARYPLAFSKQAAKVHPILSKHAGSIREKQDILARCDVRGHQFFTALAICYPTD